MSKNSADADALARYRKLIDNTTQGIGRTLRQMTANLKDAQTTWDDEAYRKLEELVVESVDTIKDAYKILLDAKIYLEALEDIVTDYDHVFAAAPAAAVRTPVIPFTMPEEKPPLDGVFASGKPRSLQKTAYGFQKAAINGREMNVYDDPVGTYRQLIEWQGYSAGRSSYQMDGTCGLCQSANLLTMAGVPTTENDIIAAALQCSQNVRDIMDMENPDIAARGGTNCFTIQEILASRGLHTHFQTIERRRKKTMEALGKAVTEGRGVMIFVEVSRLWRNGQFGGHALSVLSVSEDGRTFIYSDTGAGIMGVISADELGRALLTMPAVITDDIIR